MPLVTRQTEGLLFGANGPCPFAPLGLQRLNPPFAELVGNKDGQHPPVFGCRPVFAKPRIGSEGRSRHIGFGLVGLLALLFERSLHVVCVDRRYARQRWLGRGSDCVRRCDRDSAASLIG